jgi:hypothetical protein
MSNSPVSLSMVLASVSIAFGPSVRELRGISRLQPIVNARHAVCLIASELTGHQASTIARHLSGRDSSTARHAIAKAAELCTADSNYALKVDTARQAAIQLATSSIAVRLADIDPSAVAQRVCRDVGREPTNVSVDQIVALAVRLIDLEEVAVATTELISQLQAQDDLTVPKNYEDRAAGERLGQSIESIKTSLASTLAALGYSQKEEEIDSHTADA